MTLHLKRNTEKGFTLIELLVVVSIVSVLSSVVFASVASARTKARDTQRVQNLLQLEKAINAYYADNGTYPSTGGSSNWLKESDGVFTGPGGYVPNLAPKYISTLPTDPKRNIADPWSGFIYTSDGVNYKLLSYVTPESYPSANSRFYDFRDSWIPAPSTWKICSDLTSCNTW